MANEAHVLVCRELTVMSISLKYSGKKLETVTTTVETGFVDPRSIVIDE